MADDDKESQSTMLDDAPAAAETDVQGDPVPSEGTPPAEPSKPSTFKDFISDDGRIDENYIAKYKEYDPDVDESALKNFLESNKNDLNRSIKAALNMNSLLGKKKVPFPDENASDDEWNAFYERIGAPKEDSEYEIKEDLLEKFDESTIAGITELGKKAKIPQKLMDRILPVLAEAQEATSEAKQRDFEAEKAEAMQSLEQHFGTHGSSEFSKNLQLAKNGLKILAVDAGMEGEFDSLVEKYGNDPFLLRAFARKALETSESDSPTGGEGSLNVVAGIDEQIEAANRKYLETKSEKDLTIVMDLRQRKEKLQSL